jgi:hypothetical protein
LNFEAVLKEIKILSEREDTIKHIFTKITASFEKYCAMKIPAK